MKTSFDILENDSLCDAIFAIDSPIVVREVLDKRDEIKNIRDSLLCGLISYHEMSEWVSEKLKDFRKGERFQHEVGFSALAVCLEKIYTDNADQFINDLSSINIIEMPLSSKVAAECKIKRQGIIKDTLGKPAYFEGKCSYNKSGKFESREPRKLAIGNSLPYKVVTFYEEAA